MASNPMFQRIFRRIVREIAARQDLPIETVKERLGKALNREGENPGSPIAYFYKGNIPNEDDVKTLATAMKNQFGVIRDDLRRFLDSANYPDTKGLCDELYGRNALVDPQPPASSEIIRRAHDGLITLDRGEIERLEQAGITLARALHNRTPDTVWQLLS